MFGLGREKTLGTRVVPGEKTLGTRLVRVIETRAWVRGCAIIVTFHIRLTENDWYIQNRVAKLVKLDMRIKNADRKLASIENW